MFKPAQGEPHVVPFRPDETIVVEPLSAQPEILTIEQVIVAAVSRLKQTGALSE